MEISARVRNEGTTHEAAVRTSGTEQRLAASPKSAGRGSAVNSGEFLMLALATCYCIDIHREAARMNVPVDAVEVEARAEFAGVGLAASGFTYRARVASPASSEEIVTSR